VHEHSCDAIVEAGFTVENTTNETLTLRGFDAKETFQTQDNLGTIYRTVGWYCGYVNGYKQSRGTPWVIGAGKSDSFDIWFGDNVGSIGPTVKSFVLTVKDLGSGMIKNAKWKFCVNWSPANLREPEDQCPGEYVNP
jgi:chitodextrinase